MLRIKKEVNENGQSTFTVETKKWWQLGWEEISSHSKLCQAANSYMAIQPEIKGRK